MTRKVVVAVIGMTSFAVTWVVVGLPPLVVAGLGCLIALMYFFSVARADKGTPEMRAIATAIQEGAMAFLKYEYCALLALVAALFVLITAAVNWQSGICYLVGVATSALCGFIGMYTATSANAATAQACRKSLDAGLRVAFAGGSVMGLCVTCLGLGAISVLTMIFQNDSFLGPTGLSGFGMGASTLSILARVGGGIFTKAADVGADLVGKVEHDLPEDDIRNPATIADNVGDNVGDVAGMGADLFSSFSGSVIASSLLAMKDPSLQQPGVALPFWIAGAGIVASVIGFFLVRAKENATQHELLLVLRHAQMVSGALLVGLVALIIGVLGLSWKYFGCVVIGLAAGLAIATITEFMTSPNYFPTQSIAASSTSGAAGVIIQGLAVGYMSCIAPSLIVSAVILSCVALAGIYGIALASTGVLSILAITLATDAYGPIADNAGGIAEMAHLEPFVRHRTDILDGLGNVTAATGKGFAVVSAVLTAFSLVASFVSRVGLTAPDLVTNNYGLAGVLTGAMIPYWFAAMTMTAVARCATAVIGEVRRQLREIPGLLEGKAKADYEGCVRAIMMAALHSMVFPVLLVILYPLVLGVGLGPVFLTGALIGAIVSGLQIGNSQNVSGGAWDNAKKFVESGVLGGKKSAFHKATVVGDTVGDPFKDTSGPAVNILMKLSCYISVTLAPIFQNQSNYWWAAIIIIGVLLVFAPLWMSISPVRGVLSLETAVAQYEKELAATSAGLATQPSPVDVESPAVGSPTGEPLVMKETVTAQSSVAPSDQISSTEDVAVVDAESTSGEGGSARAASTSLHDE